MRRATIESTRKWLEDLRTSSGFSVRKIRLPESKEWSYRAGAIRHHTDKFFNVVGVRWKEENTFVEQPLLEQREVGTLGFVMRENAHGTELLVQAKIEPGNVGVVQLAPTCQATASNASRAHGGFAPPFIDIIEWGRGQVISDSLQSEQGTRFLGKFNRNILVKTTDNQKCSDWYRWYKTEDLLGLLRQDFVLNTDARSVLISSNWEALVKRTPFTRIDDVMSKALAQSLHMRSYQMSTAELKQTIMQRREEVQRAEIIDIARLSGWRFTDDGVQQSTDDGYQVMYVAVKTSGREVTKWDQPLAHTPREGVSEICCTAYKGALLFLLQEQQEPGLENRIELGSMLTPQSSTNGKIIAESKQSEEGGRFFKDIVRHRIIEIPSVTKAKPGQYWLTLGQISTLLSEGGWITNEARSTLSMLLAWL